MPVGWQVPAGQLCGLSPAGVLLQAWIPTLDIPATGFPQLWIDRMSSQMD